MGQILLKFYIALVTRFTCLTILLFTSDYLSLLNYFQFFFSNHDFTSEQKNTEASVNFTISPNYFAFESFYSSLSDTAIINHQVVATLQGRLKFVYREQANLLPQTCLHYCSVVLSINISPRSVHLQISKLAKYSIGSKSFGETLHYKSNVHHNRRYR